jgi:hypothetical protein
LQRVQARGILLLLTNEAPESPVMICKPIFIALFSQIRELSRCHFAPKLKESLKYMFL